MIAALPIERRPFKGRPALLGPMTLREIAAVFRAFVP
jgi:hypothetical protein